METTSDKISKATGKSMQAIRYHAYGSPENLQVEEIPIPTPKNGEVLIQVKAISLNASDIEFLTGSPAYIRMWGLFKPKNKILGTDVVGTVTAVGTEVKKFKLGDEVFGDTLGHTGGLAEYICAPEKVLALKPKNLDNLTAASLPQAGVVALQGIMGKVQPSDKVLINGAGGGSGSFAIQMAKLEGALVTAVDHGDKFESMRSLGADHLIDYTQEDFTQNGQQYDLILDLVGTRSVFACRHSLLPNGKYLLVGGNMKAILQAAFLGPIVSLFIPKKLGMLVVKPNPEDLLHVADLVSSQKIKAVIDQQFPMKEVKAAFERLYAGKAKGKVVIEVDEF